MARILLKNPSELEVTDMPKTVIDVLKESKVETVQAVARRGIN